CKTSALQGRRKYPLRAQREPLERDVATYLLDPPLELVLRFQRRLLAGDQPEHHRAILGHMLQRSETTRAVVVVLEKEAIELRPFEYARDRLIVAGGVELALVVAAADVHRKRDSGVAFD